jgi:hypothetical protein
MGIISAGMFTDASPIATDVFVPALFAGRLEIQPEEVFYFFNSGHAVSPVRCRGLKVLLNHHFLVCYCGLATP